MTTDDGSASSGGWPSGEPEQTLRKMEQIAQEAGWGSLGLMETYEASRRAPEPVVPPDPTPDAAALGLAIRFLRVERRISQVRLAATTGFAQSWISNVERGQRNPSWTNVARLAGALGVSLGELAQTAESLAERYGHGPYKELDFTRSR